MYCKNCGLQIDDDSNYCCFCGIKISEPIFCSGCGREAKPHANYCHNCGTKLDKNVKTEKIKIEKKEKIVNIRFPHSSNL